MHAPSSRFLPVGRPQPALRDRTLSDKRAQTRSKRLIRVVRLMGCAANHKLRSGDHGELTWISPVSACQSSDPQGSSLWHRPTNKTDRLTRAATMAAAQRREKRSRFESLPMFLSEPKTPSERSCSVWNGSEVVFACRKTTTCRGFQPYASDE